MALLGAVVLALAGLGALNALYFLLVTYGHLSARPRGLPRVCHVGRSGRTLVVHTRYASLLGLSNAAYGLVWYAVAAGAGVFLLTDVGVPFCTGLVVLAGVTVAYGAYLVWALLTQLSTPCPLCFAGHAINLALLVAFVVAC